VDEKLHILIVDDNPMMTKTLKDIFEIKGYKVQIAHSGVEALDKVVKISFEPVSSERDEVTCDKPFDCVLSDIKMPDVNGVELYKSIKSSWPDLPVILMTAYSADNLVEEGLKEGVMTVLTKPLDIDSLLNIFSNLRQELS